MLILEFKYVKDQFNLANSNLDDVQKEERCVRTTARESPPDKQCCHIQPDVTQEIYFNVMYNVEKETCTPTGVTPA